MRPVTDVTEAGKAAADAHAELTKHRHSEPYRLTVDWLDALAAQHQAQAVTMQPEKLAENQVRIRHLIALRDALVAQTGSTGFVF